MVCLKWANDGYYDMGPCELMLYTLVGRCAWADEGLIIMGSMWICIVLIRADIHHWANHGLTIIF